ncbi:hypothetical protein CBR_g49282 [Chara braunii]|uniref:TFIIS N-terminal domain-containing protein n=1 Tax=Chara braunii TaxID=69332 RepID=A0A388M4L2_CHABU|nr:hypothetical protein CBR_g49282 [Chara braunii]|eukprot:GBG89491.1 hypothetical protein CBR_g49282 [Chara braunii]
MQSSGQSGTTTSRHASVAGGGSFHHAKSGVEGMHTHGGGGGGGSAPTGKGKKRERGDVDSEPSKRERPSSRATMDGEGGGGPAVISKRERGSNNSQSKSDIDISGLVDKDGGLSGPSSVDQLLAFMQSSDVHKGGVSCVMKRERLTGIIGSTCRDECLSRFVHSGGHKILSEWMQEAQKASAAAAKAANAGGDGASGVGKDDEVESVDSFLVVLLKALEKLPLDGEALRGSSLNKCVRGLKSHKCAEVQQRAKRLIEGWRKVARHETVVTEKQEGVGGGAGAEAEEGECEAETSRGVGGGGTWGGGKRGGGGGGEVGSSGGGKGNVSDSGHPTGGGGKGGTGGGSRSAASRGGFGGVERTVRGSGSNGVSNGVVREASLKECMAGKGMAGGGSCSPLAGKMGGGDRSVGERQVGAREMHREDGSGGGGRSSPYAHREASLRSGSGGMNKEGGGGVGSRLAPSAGGRKDSPARSPTCHAASEGKAGSTTGGAAGGTTHAKGGGGGSPAGWMKADPGFEKGGAGSGNVMGTPVGQSTKGGGGNGNNVSKEEEKAKSNGVMGAGGSSRNNGVGGTSSRTSAWTTDGESAGSTQGSAGKSSRATGGEGRQSVAGAGVGTSNLGKGSGGGGIVTTVMKDEKAPKQANAKSASGFNVKVMGGGKGGGAASNGGAVNGNGGGKSGVAAVTGKGGGGGVPGDGSSAMEVAKLSSAKAWGDAKPPPGANGGGCAGAGMEPSPRGGPKTSAAASSPSPGNAPASSLFNRNGNSGFRPWSSSAGAGSSSNSSATERGRIRNLSSMSSPGGSPTASCCLGWGVGVGVGVGVVGAPSARTVPVKVELASERRVGAVDVSGGGAMGKSSVVGGRDARMLVGMSAAAAGLTAIAAAGSGGEDASYNFASAPHLSSCFPLGVMGGAEAGDRDAPGNSGSMGNVVMVQAQQGGRVLSPVDGEGCVPSGPSGTTVPAIAVGGGAMRHGSVIGRGCMPGGGDIQERGPGPAQAMADATAASTCITGPPNTNLVMSLRGMRPPSLVGVVGTKIGNVTVVGGSGSGTPSGGGGGEDCPSGGGVSREPGGGFGAGICGMENGGAAGIADDLVRMAAAAGLERIPSHSNGAGASGPAPMSPAVSSAGVSMAGTAGSLLSGIIGAAAAAVSQQQQQLLQQQQQQEEHSLEGGSGEKVGRGGVGGSNAVASILPLTQGSLMTTMTMGVGGGRQGGGEEVDRSNRCDVGMGEAADRAMMEGGKDAAAGGGGGLEERGRAGAVEVSSSRELSERSVGSETHSHGLNGVSVGATSCAQFRSGGGTVGAADGERAVLHGTSTVGGAGVVSAPVSSPDRGRSIVVGAEGSPKHVDQQPQQHGVGSFSMTPPAASPCSNAGGGMLSSTAGDDSISAGGPSPMYVVARHGLGSLSMTNREGGAVTMSSSSLMQQQQPQQGASAVWEREGSDLGAVEGGAERRRAHVSNEAADMDSPYGSGSELEPGELREEDEHHLQPTAQGPVITSSVAVVPPPDGSSSSPRRLDAVENEKVAAGRSGDVGGECRTTSSSSNRRGGVDGVVHQSHETSGAACVGANDGGNPGCTLVDSAAGAVRERSSPAAAGSCESSPSVRGRDARRWAGGEEATLLDEKAMASPTSRARGFAVEGGRNGGGVDDGVASGAQGALMMDAATGNGQSGAVSGHGNCDSSAGFRAVATGGASGGGDDGAMRGEREAKGGVGGGGVLCGRNDGGKQGTVGGEEGNRVVAAPPPRGELKKGGGEEREWRGGRDGTGCDLSAWGTTDEGGDGSSGFRADRQCGVALMTGCRGGSDKEDKAATVAPREENAGAEDQEMEEGEVGGPSDMDTGGEVDGRDGGGKNGEGCVGADNKRECSAPVRRDEGGDSNVPSPTHWGDQKSQQQQHRSALNGDSCGRGEEGRGGEVIAPRCAGSTDVADEGMNGDRGGDGGGEATAVAGNLHMSCSPSSKSGIGVAGNGVVVAHQQSGEKRAVECGSGGSRAKEEANGCGAPGATVSSMEEVNDGVSVTMEAGCSGARGGPQGAAAVMERVSSSLAGAEAIAEKKRDMEGIEAGVDAISREHGEEGGAASGGDEDGGARGGGGGGSRGTSNKGETIVVADQAELRKCGGGGARGGGTGKGMGGMEGVGGGISSSASASAALVGGGCAGGGSVPDRFDMNVGPAAEEGDGVAMEVTMQGEEGRWSQWCDGGARNLSRPASRAGGVGGEGPARCTSDAAAQPQQHHLTTTQATVSRVEEVMKRKAAVEDLGGRKMHFPPLSNAAEEKGTGEERRGVAAASPDDLGEPKTPEQGSESVMVELGPSSSSGGASERPDFDLNVVDESAGQDQLGAIEPVTAAAATSLTGVPSSAHSSGGGEASHVPLHSASEGGGAAAEVTRKGEGSCAGVAARDSERVGAAGNSPPPASAAAAAAIGSKCVVAVGHKDGQPTAAMVLDVPGGTGAATAAAAAAAGGGGGGGAGTTAFTASHSDSRSGGVIELNRRPVVEFDLNVAEPNLMTDEDEVATMPRPIPSMPSAQQTPRGGLSAMGGGSPNLIAAGGPTHAAPVSTPLASSSSSMVTMTHAAVLPHVVHSSAAAAAAVVAAMARSHISAGGVGVGAPPSMLSREGGMLDCVGVNNTSSSNCGPSFVSSMGSNPGGSGMMLMHGMHSVPLAASSQTAMAAAAGSVGQGTVVSVSSPRLMSAGSVASLSSTPASLMLQGRGVGPVIAAAAAAGGSSVSASVIATVLPQHSNSGQHQGGVQQLVGGHQQLVGGYQQLSHHQAQGMFSPTISLAGAAASAPSAALIPPSSYTSVSQLMMNGVVSGRHAEQLSAPLSRGGGAGNAAAVASFGMTAGAGGGGGRGGGGASVNGAGNTAGGGGSSTTTSSGCAAANSAGGSARRNFDLNQVDILDECGDGPSSQPSAVGAVPAAATDGAERSGGTIRVVGGGSSMTTGRGGVGGGGVSGLVGGSGNASAGGGSYGGTHNPLSSPVTGGGGGYGGGGGGGDTSFVSGGGGAVSSREPSQSVGGSRVKLDIDLNDGPSAMDDVHADSASSRILPERDPQQPPMHQQKRATPASMPASASIVSMTAAVPAVVLVPSTSVSSAAAALAGNLHSPAGGGGVSLHFPPPLPPSHPSVLSPASSSVHPSEGGSCSSPWFPAAAGGGSAIPLPAGPGIPPSYGGGGGGGNSAAIPFAGGGLSPSPPSLVGGSHGGHHHHQHHQRQGFVSSEGMRSGGGGSYPAGGGASAPSYAGFNIAATSPTHHSHTQGGSGGFAGHSSFPAYAQHHAPSSGYPSPPSPFLPSTVSFACYPGPGGEGSSGGGGSAGVPPPNVAGSSAMAPYVRMPYPPSSAALQAPPYYPLMVSGGGPSACGGAGGGTGPSKASGPGGFAAAGSSRPTLDLNSSVEGTGDGETHLDERMNDVDIVRYRGGVVAAATGGGLGGGPSVGFLAERMRAAAGVRFELGLKYDGGGAGGVNAPSAGPFIKGVENPWSLASTKRKEPESGHDVYSAFKQPMRW